MYNSNAIQLIHNIIQWSKKAILNFSPNKTYTLHTNMKMSVIYKGYNKFITINLFTNLMQNNY